MWDDGFLPNGRLGIMVVDEPTDGATLCGDRLDLVPTKRALA